MLHVWPRVVWNKIRRALAHQASILSFECSTHQRKSSSFLPLLYTSWIRGTHLQKTPFHLGRGSFSIPIPDNLTVVAVEPLRYCWIWLYWKVFHRFCLRTTKRNVYNSNRSGLIEKIKDTTTLWSYKNVFSNTPPTVPCAIYRATDTIIILVRFIDSSFVSRFSFQKGFLMEVLFLFMYNLFFTLIVK